ncbi:hypothetical protein D0Q02_16740 [Micromonospora craniellae]|uniref:Uncharacterized protein n=1 Tax=Micromonospora craniellae TaxID=2294034 RepID=A0A372FXJ0_9ACTN|nr:hypothetical protein D0Q02_16740 [Micromonospora craniellae]
MNDAVMDRHHDILRVRSFLPSLRLNLADAHRRAGDATEARRHLAVTDLAALPEDGYGTMIRSGVERARQALDAGSTAPLAP